MKTAYITIGIFVLTLLVILSAPCECLAGCDANFDHGCDVDGSDLAVLARDVGREDCDTGVPCRTDIFPAGAPDGQVDFHDIALFSESFGQTDCPLNPPENLYNIGDSIGEAEAANNDIGEFHHESVWSSGYDLFDGVQSLNERFKETDPLRYLENTADRDNIFNQAVTGSEMADFATQASLVVLEADESVQGYAGIITFLLGSNDVCAPDLATMTDPDLFEEQYRSGLDILAASPATKHAYIHVSSIPAIYWLWNAKRTNFLCWFFVWPNVPCENLLKSPGNDCGSNDSHLDPNTIHDDDGSNCQRRKLFHAAIRDIYNPILENVLMEYKADGRLPHAYYVNIFDVRFDDKHVNSGDCFHPSFEGQDLLSKEHWERSPWGMEEPDTLLQD